MNTQLKTSSSIFVYSGRHFLSFYFFFKILLSNDFHCKCIFVSNWPNSMDIWSALWILMAWGFTKASVAALMNKHTHHAFLAVWADQEISQKHNNCLLLPTVFINHVNSLAPGKFEWKFRNSIFKQILLIDGLGISCEIALIWMSLGLQWWSVNIGSGNSLVPTGTKPLSEPMLTQI